MNYYLENSTKWIPIWDEKSDGSLIRRHPLKNNGSIDWDLINKEQKHQIPEIHDVIIPNKELTYKVNTKNLGRNEKCFCGSGKKFKKCCEKL